MTVANERGDSQLPELDIRPLTTDRFQDVAALFEEGGDPRWCWCAYYRVRGTDFSKGSEGRHRAVLEDAAAGGAPSGRPPGLVAYADGRVVGWVSLGPRGDYDRLNHSKVLAPIDDAPVWSIVCFVVGRASRGRGVADALLAEAIAYARRQGATMLEAYPADVAPGERIPAAEAYKGTVPMFERAGFTVAERRQWRPDYPVRAIVRLAL